MRKGLLPEEPPHAASTAASRAESTNWSGPGAGAGSTGTAPTATAAGCCKYSPWLLELLTLIPNPRNLPLSDTANQPGCSGPATAAASRPTASTTAGPAAPAAAASTAAGTTASRTTAGPAKPSPEQSTAAYDAQPGHCQPARAGTICKVTLSFSTKGWSVIV